MIDRIHDHGAKLRDAKRVVDFAKTLGFDKVEMLFWDSDNPEFPMDDLSSRCNDECTHYTYETMLGINLGDSVFVRDTTAGDGDDDATFGVWDTEQDAKS